MSKIKRYGHQQYNGKIWLDEREDGKFCSHDDYATLKAERDALAAEAGYLRGEIKQHSESVHFCGVCGKDDPCKNDDVCWSLNHPTPATDAYLNSVRAEGVELVKAHPAISICSLTHVCEEIAAKLRACKDGE